jgi:hypothetical protein
MNENKYNSSITLLRCTSINKQLLYKCMRLAEVITFVKVKHLGKERLSRMLSM